MIFNEQVFEGRCTHEFSTYKNLTVKEELQNLDDNPLKKLYSHHPITDKQGRVLAFLSPLLMTPCTAKALKRAFDRMKIEAAKVSFKPEDFKHKRGDNFIALNVGLSYGFGHTRPTRPDLGDYGDLADVLLGDVDIQWLASYQDCKLKILAETSSS